jgi:hypothetical protein
MPNRRVWIGESRLDARPVVDATGMANEQFETELYWPIGIAFNFPGETVVLEVNEDADNYLSLPPGGERMPEPGQGIIYVPETDTQILLEEDKIEITQGRNTFTIANGKLTTDLDIETSGTISAQGNITSGADVIASGTSLRAHVHTGVTSGTAVSGLPQ